MIAPGPATRVFVALEPVDMRKGFDGLFGLASSHLGEDPLSGHLFVFANRQRTRLKILYWDGSGLWVCAKRLEKGRFSWPEAASASRGGDSATASDTPAGRVRLSAAQFAMLVGGIDLKQGGAKAWLRLNE